MTMITDTNIRAACEEFLRDWDRHEWMQEHGTWASEAHDEERERYREADETLRDAAEELAEAVADLGRTARCLPIAERADAHAAVRARADLEAAQAALKGMKEALEAVESAAQSLDDQVRPDESDYIAEGQIDPDGVSERAESLDVGASWRGWDCTESWHAYRDGSALYLRWSRDAYGSRRSRDLWVRVSGEYFEEEAS